MSNKLPHKWPGRARVIAALAEMRMHNAVLHVVLRFAAYSRSQMKAHYPELRYWYRSYREHYDWVNQHQQKR